MEWPITKEEADIVLATYQRSASHFFLYCAGQLADIKIHKTHEQASYDIPVFSIIRNPFASISSHAAMKFHLDKSSSFDTALQGCIDDYVSFYEYLKTVDHIFIYEQVISNPKPVIAEIAKIVNVPMNVHGSLLSLDYIQNDVAKNMEDAGAIASSKNLLHYEQAIEILGYSDMSKCLSLYEKAYARATFFPN
jgi:hypothetical protein